MTPSARSRLEAQGLVLLAAIAGVLVTWGAFALLDYTLDSELPWFWFRLGLGITLAALTVWSTVRQYWLATAFLALGCCITPVGEDWTWVSFLYIFLALWALVKAWLNVVSGRFN